MTRLWSLQDLVENHNIFLSIHDAVLAARTYLVFRLEVVDAVATVLTSPSDDEAVESGLPGENKNISPAINTLRILLSAIDDSPSDSALNPEFNAQDSKEESGEIHGGSNWLSPPRYLQSPVRYLRLGKVSDDGSSEVWWKLS